MANKETLKPRAISSRADLLVRRFTALEIMKMSKMEFLCLEIGALRFLGIHWQKYYEVYRDVETNDIVIVYA